MGSRCLAQRHSSWLLVERPLTDVSLLLWSSGVGRFGHHLVLESERSDRLGVGRRCQNICAVLDVLWCEHISSDDNSISYPNGVQKVGSETEDGD